MFTGFLVHLVICTCLNKTFKILAISCPSDPITIILLEDWCHVLWNEKIIKDFVDSIMVYSRGICTVCLKTEGFILAGPNDNKLFLVSIEKRYGQKKNYLFH